MSECELIENCPFFKGLLAHKEVEIEKLKDEYCRRNCLHCARFMIFTALGREMMPPDLYPHEKEVAYALIAENG